MKGCPVESGLMFTAGCSINRRLYRKRTNDVVGAAGDVTALLFRQNATFLNLSAQPCHQDLNAKEPFDGGAGR